jgi:hypothetical protein
MNARTFTTTSSVLFAVFAVMHLLRLIWQWDVIINGHSVPMWASVAAMIVSGFLSFAGFRVAQQMQKFLT